MITREVCFNEIVMIDFHHSDQPKSPNQSNCWVGQVRGRHETGVGKSALSHWRQPRRQKLKIMECPTLVHLWRLSRIYPSTKRRIVHFWEVFQNCTNMSPPILPSSNTFYSQLYKVVDFSLPLWVLWTTWPDYWKLFKLHPVFINDPTSNSKVFHRSINRK